MKITNKLGLPSPFVSMAAKDEAIEPGVYRVTSLLKGIRETMLERRHHGEIEQDVSEMIWLLFGTAAHAVLESHEESATEIKETRLKIPVDDFFLTGKFDIYDDATGMVTDYKTASVWKIIFGDFSDWRRQALNYCLMLRAIGFNAHRAEIVALLKDHSKRDAKIKPGYPPLPVHVVKFEFTEADFAEGEEWLAAKFEEVKFAETLSDDELPVCTPEERYNSGDKFAVMKKGRKTALRVLDTEDEAEDWKSENGGDFIEKRPGTDKKCIDYCAACEFCNYYRDHVKGVQTP